MPMSIAIRCFREAGGTGSAPTTNTQALAPRVGLRIVKLMRTAADLAPVLVVFLHLVRVVSLAATVATDFPRNGGLAPPQLSGDASLDLASFE